MWYPFKGWVRDWRRISEAYRLRERASRTPNLAERALLLRKALESWPTHHAAQLDLAIVLARLDEPKEAAGWWKEAIRQKPNQILTEEQYTPLLPVFPFAAKEALEGLQRNTNRFSWELYEKRDSQESEQHWAVLEGRVQRMKEMRPILHYVALVISHCAGGPARLRFTCYYYPNGNTDSSADLGESVWEWATPREVRCIREIEDSDVT